MVLSNHLSPGMTVSISGKLYRVESAVKVTVSKGKPFIKANLRELSSDKSVEKNFKVDQTIDEVSLTERRLEYLYAEGREHLFLDIDSLEIVKVPAAILSDKVDYLKEGTDMTGSFYGDTIFAVELPQFLELMVAKTDDDEGGSALNGDLKKAVLETGAKVNVPPFIGVGDIIKVDTKTHEYVQRV